MTLKLSIKLVLSCLVSHLVNKFKVSNFDWHDWRTVARVGPDLNSLKQRLWHDCKQPPFSPIDWNVLQDCLHAVIDNQKDQISFHNSYLTICWVNLEVFPTLGTRYGLISGIKALFPIRKLGNRLSWPTRSNQIQVELSEWATGYFMHWSSSKTAEASVVVVVAFASRKVSTTYSRKIWNEKRLSLNFKKKGSD